MRYYQNVNRPLEEYIAPVDLQTIGNAYNTLEQGHLKALELRNQLDTAIANLDLNEAEDEFRQSLSSGIKNTIDENSYNGNAYYALDDLIKVQGDIARNPGLIGRLRAQQAYKLYQTNIDARKDINQDTKEWAKELNPYHYKDKLDNKGNIIDGEEWKPGFTPVSDIDFNEVFDAVTKQLKPKSGSFSGSNYFAYSDGTFGNKFIPGKTTGVLGEGGSSYEKLTNEMISSAIDNAFQNNPQLAAGAKQAYDVLKWKADKGDLTKENDNGTYFGKDGVSKTYNQYIRDMIDGYASTHEYNKTVSKQTYNNAAVRAAMGIDGSSSSSKSSSSKSSGADDFSTTGLQARSQPYASFNVKKSMFAPATANYTRVNSTVASALYDAFGVKLESPISSSDDIINAVGNRNLTDQQKEVLNNIVTYYNNEKDKWGSEFEQISNIVNGDGSEKDSKANAASVIYSMITQGKSLDSLSTSENPYIQEYLSKYDKNVDDVFKNYTHLTFKAKDDNEFNNAILKSGNSISDLRNMGFIINGNEIAIPKENHRLLYVWNRIIDNAKGNVYGIEDGKKEHRLTVSDEGRAFRDIAGTPLYAGIRASLGKRKASRSRFSKNIDSFVQDLDSDVIDTYNQNLYNGEEFIGVGSSRAMGANPTANQYGALLEVTGEAAYKRMMEAANSAVQNYVGGAHIDEPIYLVDERGQAKLVDDPAEKAKILNQMKYGKHKVFEPHIAIVQGLGYLPALKFRVDDAYINDENKNAKDVATYDVVFTNYAGDPDYERVNNRPDVKNQNQLMSYIVNGNIPVNIGFLGNDKVQAKWVDDSENGITSDYIYNITIGGKETNMFASFDDINNLNIHYQNLIDYRSQFKEDMNKINNNKSLSAEERQQVLGAYLNQLLLENSVFGDVFGKQQGLEIILNTLRR